MSVARLISLLAGLLFVLAAPAMAFEGVTGHIPAGPAPEKNIAAPGQLGVKEAAKRPAKSPFAKPVAQSGRAVVNGMAIQTDTPTCSVSFTVHVNVNNQSGDFSAPGTVSLQNIHRGTGGVNYTGFGNYPSLEPGGNYVVVFQVVVSSYISRGQELVASTNGSSFNLKWDLERGHCPRTDSSSPAPQPPAPGTGSSLQVAHSGKCMDVPGGSRDFVTPVQQFSCTGAGNQDWAIQNIGNGFFRIVSRFSGMCLDVQGASHAPQALVQQYPCNGGDNQTFSFRYVSGDYNMIVAKHSGMCLDVRGASTNDLTPIQQYSCTGNGNQQWAVR